MRLSTPLPAWLRRATAIAAVGLSLVLPSQATATLRYDLQIYGLVCGLCADGLGKNLQALATDVAHIDIDLERGHAAFVTTANSIIEPGRIREAVMSVGFDPRALTLTATGTLAGDRHALRLDIGNARSIRLGEGPALDSLRKLLDGKPTEVTISGTLSGAGDTLHLHAVEVDPS